MSVPAGWFYSRTPGAPVLRDVAGSKDYVRFGEADAAALEAAFSDFEDECLSAWRIESAEAISSSSGVAVSKSQLPPASRTLPETTVVVRSGHWEVDIPKRMCQTCYWGSPSPIRVLRSIWFCHKSNDWMTCGLALADLLEAAYQSRVWESAKAQQGGLLASRVSFGPSFSSGLHALFVSETEAWLCMDSISGKLLHATGFSGGDKASPGLRLRRGFAHSQANPLAEEEKEDDRNAQIPVTHMVLVTHGIGHTLDSFDMVQDANLLRKNVRILSNESLPGTGFGRLMVIPVQWRRQLVLAGEAVADDLVPDILSLLPVRRVLNALVIDIFNYWTSSAQDLVDALVDAFNDQYVRFQARNPGFQGTVGIVAHSLGSVLSYDILCNQAPAGGGAPGFSSAASRRPSVNAVRDLDGFGGGPDDRIVELEEELRRVRADLTNALQARNLQYKALVFPTEFLVLLGSPLGLFLTLRGGAPSGMQSVSGDLGGNGILGGGMPVVKRLVNLIHPYDPISYKLEPLTGPGRKLIKPALVPYHKAVGGRRLAVEVQERVESTFRAANNLIQGPLQLVSTFGSRLATLSFKKNPSAGSDPDLSEGGPSRGSVPLGEDQAERDAGERLLCRLAGCGPGCTGDHHIDYIIQVAELENPFIGQFISHMGYWGDMDVALFLLNMCGYQRIMQQQQQQHPGVVGGDGGAGLAAAAGVF